MTDRRLLTQEDLAPASVRAWEGKYQFRRPDGAPVDTTIEHTWGRVAMAVAAAESEGEIRRFWNNEFYEAMRGFRFLPAGRIVAGAGTGRRVTLMNCYVLGTIPDSLDGIFDHLKEAAMTLQQGGGIGMDFSTLRPTGAPVRGVDSTSSGPVSFMRVWDAMCKTIMSAGTRRGAMMAMMRVDHPSIEEFIEAKRDARELRNFNVSVAVTDAFMAAVEADGPHDLFFDGKVYKTVRARDLWAKIMRATYDAAEPGVVFIDRVNREHPLNYVDTIAATNPCGEKPLAPYASCCLGSINLAALVLDPYGPSSRLDVASLKSLTRTAIRFLDDVIDVSGYPLPAQEVRAKDAREVGLGVTGLADALLMVGLRYGSPEAALWAESYQYAIACWAYEASIDLAAEKGAFPLWDRVRHCEGPAGKVIQELSREARDAYERTGLRNGLLLSIAPTGTISLMANNVSSGIEPIFAGSYTRKVLQPDGSRREERVVDHALRVWDGLHRNEPWIGAGEIGWRPPPEFVTAQDLSPAEHVRMQAAVQKHVDSAVSKTVNVPADISFEDFEGVYLDAWRSGCKGITTFRPNATTGSVLTADEAPKVDSVAGQPAKVIDKLTLDETAIKKIVDDVVADFQKPPPPRAEKLAGATYKLRWPGSEHAFYVTVNDAVDPGGARRPFEVFVNSADFESYAWVVALTRMVSAVYRRGGDIGFVAEELKRIHDPRGGHWERGKYVPSLVAAIGDVLERHARGEGTTTEGPETAPKPVIGKAADGRPDVVNLGVTCPRCARPAVFAAEGCRTCLECGWSKCE
jgi:ribonucleoside-diphosphate reductase alpha chain